MYQENSNALTVHRLDEKSIKNPVHHVHCPTPETDPFTIFTTPSPSSSKTPKFHQELVSRLLRML